MAEPIVSLTPAATARARDLLARHSQAAVGIRLAVKTTGCSGFSYLLDFTDEVRPGDAVIEHDGVRLVVDAKATKLVAGTRVDYVEDRLGAQFVFENPHEKARCGCGESFTV